MAKSVITIKQSDTGRNILFKDKKNGSTMTDKQFVKKIESGFYEGDYHNRVINHKKTPVSNPDKRKSNNLG